MQPLMPLMPLMPPSRLLLPLIMPLRAPQEKDVLRLTKPGSSFAAAGAVKVKVYHHTVT